MSKFCAIVIYALFVKFSLIDPFLFPIPPGFEVKGDISSDFEKYKTTTSYGSFFGNKEFGYSHRWKNQNIKSADIVLGFQFKIGPEVAQRWTFKRQGRIQVKEFKDRFSGDINIIFPRAEPGTNLRGVYGLNIEWTIPQDGVGDDRVTSQPGFYKEIPHGDYSGEHGFDGLFNVENPMPHIGNVIDGKWHGFLAAIWNQEYNKFPAVAAWYNPSDTLDFKDYIFLGMGVDQPPDKLIPPREPLSWGINEKSEFGSNIWGNALFKAEHDLGVRIDEFSSENVAVKNMYAANVFTLDPNPLTRDFFNLWHLLNNHSFIRPASVTMATERFGMTFPKSLRELAILLQRTG